MVGVPAAAELDFGLATVRALEDAGIAALGAAALALLFAGEALVDGAAVEAPQALISMPSKATVGIQRPGHCRSPVLSDCQTVIVDLL
ncbi:MAG: hypothetical protein ACYDAG_06600 [Chloroflexota bacterium]